MEEVQAEEIVSLRKRVVAELVGTFALVFAAAGSSMASSIYNEDLGKFAVAAAPGLVITAMTFALDKISGAYFNPAISIGYVLSKHLAPSDLVFYVGAQVAGAILASLVLLATLGMSTSGLTIPSGKGGWPQSFVFEIVLTFLLMFVSISMKEEKRKTGYKSFGPIAIGWIIILDTLIGMNISGGSMNPARSFGPALVFGNLSYNWIYWAAPIIGALLGVIVFKAVESRKFYVSKTSKH